MMLITAIYPEIDSDAGKFTSLYVSLTAVTGMSGYKRLQAQKASQDDHIL